MGDDLVIGYEVGRDGGHTLKVKNITLFGLEVFWKQKDRNGAFETGILATKNPKGGFFEKSVSL